jgi:hypothetical protein
LLTATRRAGVLGLCDAGLCPGTVQLKLNGD